DGGGHQSDLLNSRHCLLLPVGNTFADCIMLCSPDRRRRKQAQFMTHHAITDLKALLGDRLSTSEAVRLHHGTDLSYNLPAPPDAVAFAETTAEVAEIVRICARHKTPVIPYGTGTSLEGH